MPNLVNLTEARFWIGGSSIEGLYIVDGGLQWQLATTKYWAEGYHPGLCLWSPNITGDALSEVSAQLHECSYVRNTLTATYEVNCSKQRRFDILRHVLPSKYWRQGPKSTLNL